MQLKHLTVTGFKNIGEASLEFSPKINCFLGNNGMGKSNLLDAIYFLSFCKSFSGAQDPTLIRRGDEFAMLKGDYERRGMAEEVQAALQQGRRKTFKRSGKTYSRLTEHIGLFPLVMVSPADMDLVTGEPSERRRFIDTIIAQSDARYLDTLLRYNSALQQRNALLKAETPAADSLFEALEIQLEMGAAYIEDCRKRTVDELQTLLKPYYKTIADCDEEPSINYRHADYSAEGGLAAHLARLRNRDLALGYTASGPHRDDIELTLDGMSLRRTASQGQTKTFTSALRFAQYELLHRSLSMRPLLLLDDIFDKLDAGRVSRIMSLVGSSDTFGQIFITDTNRKHLDEIVADIPGGAQGSNYRLWTVKEGSFSEVHSAEQS